MKIGSAFNTYYFRGLWMICGLILFLLSGFRPPAAGGTAISGKVVDGKTGEGVDFANVVLLKQDDGTLVKSLMTQLGGEFRFENIAAGVYKIKVSMVGYLPDTLANIVLAEGKLKRIPPLKLKKDAQSLQEVMITERKPEVQFGTDTITYNLGSSILSEGSTASDVLRNVPMVDVDIDGKVSIAGKRNTRIFINGKPSDYMSSNMADLLSVLPSDAIEKIEVITNPDVRYSADGEGIVNIVLKKGYKIGLNGTLSSSAGTAGTYTGSAYTAYRTTNLALSSSYGYRSNLRQSNSASLTENFKNEVLSSFRNRFNDGSSVVDGHNLRAGLDWDITPKKNFSINLNGSLNGNSGDSFSDDQRLNSESVLQELRQQRNSSDNNNKSLVLDADYSFRFGKKKAADRFEIGLISSLNNADQLRIYERSVSRPNTTAINPFLQHNANNEDNSGIILNSDYVRTLKKFGTVSAGIQGSFKVNRKDQDVDEFDYATGVDVPNLYLSNRFKFFESIFSGYASYNYRTKTRWSFRAGGRAELTDARFEQEKTSNISMKPYFNAFPNLGIGKTFRKKYVTGLNYSVRINRPRDYALNPLINNSDSTNIFFGNPELKPSVTNQLELSFSTYGARWSVSPRIGYSRTSDIIERVRTPVDENGNFQTTYKNLASSDLFSANLFGNYRPVKAVSLNGGFSLSRISYHSNLNSGRSGLNYRGNLGMALRLPYKIAAEGNLSYYNNASAQGRNKASLASGIGLRKLFFKNKLVTRLLATDPFNQRSNTEIVEGLDYRQRRYVTQASRNFSFALSYRFTKTGRNTLNKQKKDPNEKGDRVLEE